MKRVFFLPLLPYLVCLYLYCIEDWAEVGDVLISNSRKGSDIPLKCIPEAAVATNGVCCIALTEVHKRNDNSVLISVFKFVFFNHWPENSARI